MEITNIKETMISEAPQGTTPGRLKRSVQADEQAGQSGSPAELVKKVFKGDPENISSLLGKDIKGLQDRTLNDLTDEAVKGLTERLNQVVDAMHSSLQFVVDRDSGDVVIKVLDNDGHLIRRIPPEVMVSFSDMGVNLGLLFNTEL